MNMTSLSKTDCIVPTLICQFDDVFIIYIFLKQMLSAVTRVPVV